MTGSLPTTARFAGLFLSVDPSRPPVQRLVSRNSRCMQVAHWPPNPIDSGSGIFQRRRPDGARLPCRNQRAIPAKRNLALRRIEDVRRRRSYRSVPSRGIFNMIRSADYFQVRDMLSLLFSGAVIAVIAALLFFAFKGVLWNRW
jgi:hypothetical protein